MDALRLRELNLLILSYLLRQTHNTFIRENTYYGGDTNAISDIYYYLGGIVGVLLTGMLSDLWLVGKRFLMIFLLNSLLLCWDIYLFVSASPAGQPLSEGGLVAFSIFLGVVLESNNLIYLILMPMLIAKKHSEKMS